MEVADLDHQSQPSHAFPSTRQVNLTDHNASVLRSAIVLCAVVCVLLLSVEALSYLKTCQLKTPRGLEGAGPVLLWA